ncbi:MAG: GNAT family N-acetyltransferase [Prevotellaceae bacterium]|jgi:ribosomal protein S18 acetylase RimI-like enzyme|nr:GNAT family N-acetyltransferase [Prevotellaceae bacterium]
MDVPGNDIIEIKDSTVITKILNESFLTVANEFGYTMENAPRFGAFIKEDVIEKDFQYGTKIFGFQMDNITVACAGFSKNRNGIYEIKRLAVMPDYRHLGIGKKLLLHNENEIKTAGEKIVEVHIVDSNELLKEWYKNNGYKEIKVEEIKCMPFKSCIMQKELWDAE